jgi:hypothetical protein
VGGVSGRVVALAAALGGLLAVVAAASAVSAPASEGGGLGLPEWVVAYAYATLVLVALAGIPTLVLLGIRELPEDGRNGRQRWLSPLVLAALVVVAVAISSRSDGRLSEILARLRVVEPTAAEAEAARPPEPAWLPVLVASAIAVGGVVVLGRRSRPRRQGLGDRLEAALGQPLADLRDEPDVRRAIVAAFARLELALEAAGAPRGPGEAPLEYVGRVLGELDVPPEPLDELASLFEQAKFSLHALDEADREAAIDALEAVREALR